MSSRSRTQKKFWKSVFQLFIIYIIIIPILFYILDQQTFLKLLRKDTDLFILEMVGIPLAIAMVISYWTKSDPELKRW
jgi:hypothetical protein